MNEMRELSERDRDVLRRDFPNHRFEDLGKRAPEWVRQACENARKELIESGMLLPYARSEVIGLGAGSEYKIIEHGTLICSSSKEGEEQVALLLGKEQAWLIAHWNVKTGEALPFSEIGRPVQMPSENEKGEIKIVRQEALRHAEKELERMQKEEDRFMMRLFLFLVIAFSLFFIRILLS